jgi:hypothetical protein
MIERIKNKAKEKTLKNKIETIKIEIKKLEKELNEIK